MGTDIHADVGYRPHPGLPQWGWDCLARDVHISRVSSITMLLRRSVRVPVVFVEMPPYRSAAGRAYLPARERPESGTGAPSPPVPRRRAAAPPGHAARLPGYAARRRR